MLVKRIISKVKTHIREKGIWDTLDVGRNIATGLASCYLNPCALTTNKLPTFNPQQIKEEMEKVGLEVVPYQIQVAAFLEWLHQAEFPEYYSDSYKDVFIEKALEHYISADLLKLSPGQILVDIAASRSPWFNMAPRLFGVTALALDLFPPTSPLPGLKIAADATFLPFPDNSIDALALHCAFETFEGDADSRFIPETARVLRPGGRMAIIPLYMHHLHFADSSPWADRRGLAYQGASMVWRKGKARVRFSRKYDVAAFKQRIVSQKGPLRLTIYYILNEKDVSPVCYLKFAAVFEKNISEK